MKKPVSKRCTCHDCFALIIKMTEVFSERMDLINERIDLISKDNIKQGDFNEEVTKAINYLKELISTKRETIHANSN